jgi:hypothetical protein
MSIRFTKNNRFDSFKTTNLTDLVNWLLIFSPVALSIVQWWVQAPVNSLHLSSWSISEEYFSKPQNTEKCRKRIRILRSDSAHPWNNQSGDNKASRHFSSFKVTANLSFLPSEIYFPHLVFQVWGNWIKMTEAVGKQFHGFFSIMQSWKMFGFLNRPIVPSHRLNSYSIY